MLSSYFHCISPCIIPSLSLLCHLVTPCTIPSLMFYSTLFPPNVIPCNHPVIFCKLYVSPHVSPLYHFVSIFIPSLCISLYPSVYLCIPLHPPGSPCIPGPLSPCIFLYILCITLYPHVSPCIPLYSTVFS